MRRRRHVTSVFHLQLAVLRVWLLYLSSSTYDFMKLLGKIMPRFLKYRVSNVLLWLYLCREGRFTAHSLAARLNCKRGKELLHDIRSGDIRDLGSLSLVVLSVTWLVAGSWPLTYALAASKLKYPLNLFPVVNTLWHGTSWLTTIQISGYSLALLATSL